MPYFICRLATEDGRIFSQSFLAPSQEECQKHFESEGLCVLSVKKDWKKKKMPLLPFEKKIKDKDFIMFNQEFVALLKAGYPIIKSIEIIISRVKNIHLKELLMLVSNDVKGGKSLSEAFVPYENNFSKVYIASIMAGERSGNLPSTIHRYVQYAKVISVTKSKIRSALTYPTLLLFFSAALLGILINFIIPRFSSFYEDFEAQLPWITRALMAFSFAVRHYFYFFLAFIVGLGFLFFHLRKREKGLVLLDRMKLKIPYGNMIWLESAVSLFCRSLGLLLEGGISLLTSIGIARHAVSNKFLFHRMDGVSDSIKNGESLSESLAKSEFFPPLSLDMIKIGETSANLDGMLLDVADVYDERIQAKIDTFVSLVEPLIIIFMGIIVAAMLLSVYLPIFNIIRVVR